MSVGIPVDFSVMTGCAYGLFRGVQTDDMGTPALESGHAETSGVAKGIEHRSFSYTLHQQTAAVALV